MSSGQASYYLGLAREDYYLQGGEPPGQWYGQGAATLGLVGEVQPDQLYNLFSGLSPDGTKPMVQLQAHQGKAEHRPGWDLTFSAPKSVSVLWSQLPEESRVQIQKAHHGAVRAALEYFQDTSALTRRGERGSHLEPSKLIVATFEHSTSRALDPQLHSHALVMNIGVREDGTTGTLSSLQIFQAKMAAGALYRAQLAHDLEQELGITVERKDRWFEVSGVSSGLIDRFSKRRAEIEEVLSKRGVSSAKSAAAVAIETRESKEAVSRNELFAEWQTTGASSGWATKEAESLLGREYPRRQPEKELRECLVGSLATLTKSQAHFTERDLVRHVAEEAQGRGIGAREVTEFVRSATAQAPEIVRLGWSQGEVRFSTQEMMRIEESLLRSADSLFKNMGHSLSADEAVREIAKTERLSEEQTRAVWHLIHESGGIGLVSGMAGTGKTTMLSEARRAWESQGFNVIGGAIAARAARELQQGAGIESTTIARRLSELESGKGHLDSRTVLVIDEAGMVATPDMERLAHHAQVSGAKLVLIGDERQLQPIGPGAPFKELAQRYGKADLQEIKRQFDPWTRKAVKDVADGRARDALAEYASRGLVHVGESKHEARQALITQWQADSGPLTERLILAGTRRDVKELNHLAQDARLGAGELSGPSSMLNGDRVYVGDRLLFIKNKRALGVLNGSKGTVEGISEDGAVFKVRLDSGERLSLPSRSEGGVTLGYASTTHKAQGATSQKAYVLAGGSLQDRELSYVQASRARSETRFFVSASDVGDTVAELAREMERTRQKQMAQEVIRRQNEPATDSSQQQHHRR